MLKGSSIRGKLFSISPWTEIEELTGGWEGSELQAGLRLHVQSSEVEAKPLGLSSVLILSKLNFSPLCDIQQIGGVDKSFLEVECCKCPSSPVLVARLLGDAVFSHVLCVTVQNYITKFLNISAELLSLDKLLLQHFWTHPVLLLPCHWLGS